jgi:hypothetical protein
MATKSTKSHKKEDISHRLFLFDVICFSCLFVLFAADVGILVA